MSAPTWPRPILRLAYSSRLINLLLALQFYGLTIVAGELMKGENYIPGWVAIYMALGFPTREKLFHSSSPAEHC